MNQAIENIMFALEELAEDTTLPRNVKQKIANIVINIKGKELSHLEVSKVIHELEELGEDMNLQAYTRTQLFNVVSLLEAM